MKTLLALLLLIPSLSWGKNYITCAGASGTELKANIYNFEINKSELKIKNIYLNAGVKMLSPNIYFGTLKEPIKELTEVTDETLFTYRIVYELDELSQNLLNYIYELDTLSGFMIRKEIYFDKDGEGIFVYDYDDNKIFLDENAEDFNKYLKKSYYECKKVKPLFE